MRDCLAAAIEFPQLQHHARAIARQPAVREAIQDAFPKFIALCDACDAASKNWMLFGRDQNDLCGHRAGRAKPRSVPFGRRGLEGKKNFLQAQAQQSSAARWSLVPFSAWRPRSPTAPPGLRLPCKSMAPLTFACGRTEPLNNGCTVPGKE